MARVSPPLTGEVLPTSAVVSNATTELPTDNDGGWKSVLFGLGKYAIATGADLGKDYLSVQVDKARARYRDDPQAANTLATPEPAPVPDRQASIRSFVTDTGNLPVIGGAVLGLVGLVILFRK